MPPPECLQQAVRDGVCPASRPYWERRHGEPCDHDLGGAPQVFHSGIPCSRPDYHAKDVSVVSRK